MDPYFEAKIVPFLCVPLPALHPTFPTLGSVGKVGPWIQGCQLGSSGSEVLDQAIVWFAIDVCSQYAMVWLAHCVAEDSGVRDPELHSFGLRSFGASHVL